MDAHKPHSRNQEKALEGKGKGKAADAAPAAGDKDEDGDGSPQSPRTARVASSAMALGKSLVTSPSNASDVGRIMPEGKAQSSTYRRPPSAGETSLRYTSQSSSPTDGGTFKSAHVQDHVAREEASFSSFLDGTDFESTSQPLAVSDGLPTGEQLRLASHNHSQLQPDGMEVVKLLDSGFDEVAQPEPDVPMSREQEAALRKSLFDEAGSRERAGTYADWQDWDGLLNFLPEYISNGGSDWGHRELLQHFGTSDVTEARQIWLSQWIGVLNSYTDSVWGGLSPLVEEAREEVRRFATAPQTENSTSEPKALERLRQILAHLRTG